jgi:hypothetical protein
MAIAKPFEHGGYHRRATSIVDSGNDELAFEASGQLGVGVAEFRQRPLDQIDRVYPPE